MKTYEEIPTAKDDRLETTVYGNLNIVYDKKEIEKKLENGEVVFIATTSTDLSRKLKNEFKEQCFSVVMKGVPIDERKMVREDLRRYYNVSYHDATEQQISESKKRISKRLEDFEKAMQRFESFLQDEELGPDYVFKNWFHFLEKFSCLKDLDGRIGDRNDHEFEMLLYNIFCVYDRINRNKEWKQQFSLSKEKREELQGKLFTMWDSYSEYVRNNNSKE